MSPQSELAEAAWLAGIDYKRPESVSSGSKRSRAEKAPRVIECYVCGAIWPLAPIFAGERRCCLYCLDKLDR